MRGDQKAANGPRLRLHTQNDNAEAQNAPPCSNSDGRLAERVIAAFRRARLLRDDPRTRRCATARTVRRQSSNANPEPPPLRVATAASLFEQHCRHDRLSRDADTSGAAATLKAGIR